MEFELMLQRINPCGQKILSCSHGPRVYCIDPLPVSTEANLATRRYEGLRLDLEIIQTPYHISVSWPKKLEPWERTSPDTSAVRVYTARLPFHPVLDVRMDLGR